MVDDLLDNILRGTGYEFLEKQRADLLRVESHDVVLKNLKLLLRVALEFGVLLLNGLKELVIALALRLSPVTRTVLALLLRHD